MPAQPFLVVGSLNRQAPYFEHADGVGLSVFRFDSGTGRVEPICEERSVDNPTFLSVDPQSNCVYAVSEVFGWHEGTVSAYRFDPGAKRLVYVNKQPTLGSVTAHCSFDRDRRHLLVANYAMGPVGEGPDCAAVVFPIGHDGALGAPLSWVRHEGHGPNPERQERPHPHCIVPSPDGRFAIVADLGLDRLFTYALSPDGVLSEQPAAVLPLPPGSGPRHLVFHQSGRHALLICELSSTIVSLHFDAASGRFTPAASVSAVPDDWRGGNDCSDIQLHPNGRFVYGGNRGHDSVAMISFDPTTGELAVIGHVPCGGRTPRNLAIDPAGRFLLVANQNGGVVSVLAIDQTDGTLSEAETVRIGSPMCLKFL